MPTPSRLQPADDREELVDLGVVQRRGRLVHDQDARAVGQRLGDLDHLLARDGQPRHFRARVELQVHRREDLGGVGVELAVVEQHAAELLRLAADEDVLRRRQVGHQVQFLMDDADAELLRAARASRSRPACRRAGSRLRRPCRCRPGSSSASTCRRRSRPSAHALRRRAARALPCAARARPGRTC